MNKYYICYKKNKYKICDYFYINIHYISLSLKEYTNLFNT